MPLFNDLTLHKVLGCGKTRVVWLTTNKTAVKMCHRFHNGTANRMEWAIWHNADPELKKILVKPISIHENGIYMVVTLGERVQKHEIPKNIPPYITDAKASNWVKINGVVLLADYAQGGVIQHLGLNNDKLCDENYPVEKLCKKLT